MTRGHDDVRGRRARVPGAAVAATIATARRFASMLALNPRAIADARALDAERAAGRVRSPLHGIPVVFKDNIDVLGLPTTGGSRALVDHRPRLDSRVAAGMRRAGAVMLGKANLDEFPFGDFGISTVGGTIGNAYDPSLSTAGSSGGSATAVATSLVDARLRHRHLQLAVEPGGVRVAGHDPHDARPDEPRRRDAAQHLQRRGRPDGEVGARAGAGARSGDRRRTRRTRRPRTRRATSADRSRRRSTRRRSRARASACCASSSSASPASAKSPPTMDTRRQGAARGRRDRRRRGDSRISTRTIARRAAARRDR